FSVITAARTTASHRTSSSVYSTKTERPPSLPAAATGTKLSTNGAGPSPHVSSFGGLLGAAQLHELLLQLLGLLWANVVTVTRCLVCVALHGAPSLARET